VKRLIILYTFFWLILPLAGLGQLSLVSGPAPSFTREDFSLPVNPENIFSQKYDDCTFVPLLNGPSSVCEISTGNVYTTDPGGSGYTWNISAGGMITAGSGTNTVTVTWNNPGNQWISVDFTNASGCTALAPAVLNVSVNPNLQASVSIAASANPVCQGSTATFTATPVNGGSSPSYQWKVNNINQGTNSAVFSYVPVNSDQVKCVMTSNYGCSTSNPATSNTVFMAVSNNLPVSVSVTAAPSGQVCDGTQVTFTATPFNGGSNPSYQWKVNGVNAGTNNFHFSYIPQNGDIVTCVLTSNTPCSSGNPATSAPITMSVISSIPVSVSITASSNPVCAGTSVNFTATPVNGGASPTYQWILNGAGAGTNSPVFTHVPVNGDQVSCFLLSSLSNCATNNPAASNVISMTVNPILPVSVSIGVSANPVCEGTSVTYTAYPVYGGSNPSYQWKVNGINTGTNSPTFSHIPVNGESVSCVLTSSESCPFVNPVTSNSISMTVYQVLPVSVSITASLNPVCSGDPVTFSATPVNGGTLPVYEWYVNGTVQGGLGSSFTYIPAAGDQVSCRLTSYLNCTTNNPAYSNTITMSLDPELPASVSIAASMNPYCPTIPVDFTATPVNGGTAPSFQWLVNGINSGSNNPLFSYSPTNGDVVNCILTSNAHCATGSPTTSNTLVMIVDPDPPIPVSVSISASANPVCTGLPVTFTAAPVNAGTSPLYQWKVNGINAGTSNPVFTFIPADGDVVSLVLTSSDVCTTGNPATSNSITITVSPYLPVSLTVTASQNPSCLGATVTFNSIAVNGGTSPSYQWQVNGINTGTNTANFSYTPSNGDQVRCILTSSLACATGSPATSNTIGMAVTTSPVSVSVTASSNPACQGTPVNFTAVPVNGGSSPAFQWKVNGVNTGINSPALTYVPVNGDAVNCILTSNVNCPAGSPATSNTVFMTMDPILPVSVSIAASTNPVCSGSTVSFTATPVNGGSNPVYQWQVNGINSGGNSPTLSYVPLNGDQVRCILTSGYACPSGSPATSNTISMSVTNALPVSVSISASANPVCLGASVTFTAVPVNGGTAPILQWKVNGINQGSNSTSFTYFPFNGDIVTCILTSNHSCASGSPATSNSIPMTVNPYLPVSVGITASANPVCQGTVATFTATPVNGGTSPAYQWQVNGVNAGTNSPSFSYSPAQADLVTCILTSNYACTSWNPATSNTIAMTVDPSMPVSVTVSPSSNPSCIGNPVTFIATPVNGGTNPVYQWQVNGVNAGSNSPVFSYTPVNGDQVVCTLSSNALCATGSPATSNITVMTVNPFLPVSVSISPSANPVCQGNSVTFLAAPVNGGSGPAYQWLVNGVPYGTNSSSFTFAPSNGDAVSCVLTSSESCSTGNPATSAATLMTVNPSLPVSVSISASSNPVCTGSSVTLTAVPVNGGPTPIYQWQVNGINVGANSSTYTYIPSDGDQVKCILTSDVACPTGNPATSNTIVMQVSPSLLVSLFITANHNPCCTGSLVIFTAYPTNGGPTPAFQWQVNGINMGSNSSSFSYIPSNGDQVTCILTSSYLCPTTNPVTSNIIVMSVVNQLGVDITIAASANPVCQGTAVTFTATPVNGGYTPFYQWQVNGVNSGSDSDIFTYIPSNGDVVVCILTSSEDCTLGNPATSDPVTMTVHPNLPVSISISASSTIVCQGTSVTFTSSTVNGGPGPAYQWQVNGVNAGTNSPGFSFIPSDGNVVTCILTSNALCPTGNPATSNSVALTVGSNFPVSISIIADPGGSVCAGTPVTFTATPVNGGSSPSYQWKVNGINKGTNSPVYTYTPLNNDQVQCILSSTIACSSGSPATSNTLSMTVNPYLPVSVSINTPLTSVCNGATVNFTATPVNGGMSPVIQWQVNGINAGTNSNTFSFIPSNGDAVSCILTSSEPCNTGNPATSNTVTMTVKPDELVSVSITTPAAGLCQGAAASFTAAAVNGGSAPVYQWKVNGSNAGTNSSAFNYLPADGDVVTCMLTSNASCPVGNPATSNPISMSVVPAMAVSVSISTPATTVCQGTTVSFTAVPVNGGNNPSYQWKVNGSNTGTNSASFSYIPLNGDLVSCVLTSDYYCPTGNPAASNTVVMTVTPNLPVSVTVSTPVNPVCPGNAIIFTAVPVNGGANPVYQWQVNGNNVGSNNPAFTYLPANGDQVSCILTSGESCASGNPATSNTVTVTVNPALPVSVSINPSANPVCQGSNVTFSASPVNGGSTPGFQWKVNGINAGTNSAAFSYSPSNNDAVSCVVTSSEACTSGNPATSNSVIMNVTPNLPVSVVIDASANPSCPGSLVTFTAAGVNGGSSPSYQWQVNGSNVGTNSPSYSVVPTVNDQVICILTSNETCISGNPATSNTIIVTNGPPLPVSVSISASSNPVCQGAVCTFTASPVNGGSNPFYQWLVNGLNAGTNSAVFNYIPGNNDRVKCILTSSYGCPTGNPATSNTLYMAVSTNLPVSISVTATPAGPVCEGTAVTFFATPVNGGSSPAYQWKVNGNNVGPNDYHYTYVPLDGDVVTCTLISNTPCSVNNPATSDPITINVTPSVPVSVSISESANPICAGTSVTFTAAPVNGGNTPVYQWVVNGSGAGADNPVFTYNPSNGDQVSCYLLSNSTGCVINNPAASNVVSMTVYPILPAGINILASGNPVCEGTTVTYTAYPGYGGPNPVFQWYVNGVAAGTNSTTFSYLPADADIVSCVMTSSEHCPIGSPASSNVIPMTVYQVMPVSVSITASGNPVCIGSLVTFTATPVNGGALPIFEWYVNGQVAGGMGSTFTYVPADQDQVSCRLTSYLFCTSGNPAMSNTIQMTINPELPVSLGIAASQNPFCLGGMVDFTATAVNPGTAPVYQWQVNGFSLGANSPVFSYPPSNGDAVTCVLNSSATCATGNPATSNTLVMILNPDPPLPVAVTITTSANPVCTVNPVTFTATPSNGGMNPVYQWQVNGISQGPNNPVYSYIPTNGDQVSCILNSSSGCAIGNPATSNSITIIKNALSASFNLCNSVTTHDAAPFTLGLGLPLGGTWSGTGITGNTFIPASVPANRDTVTITYTATNITGCISSSSQLIKLYPSSAGFTCGQAFTDVRDNRVYQSKLIGTQCWMAENLDFGTFVPVTGFQTNNCVAEKYCYNDVPGNCSSRGGLYMWDELMQYQSAPGSQGLCPPAWHIPTEAEWFTLESVLNGQGNAGDSLKAGGFSGFNAILAGVIYSKTTWAFPGFASLFWTSTPTSAFRAMSHGLNQPDKSVSDYPALRSNAFSVRCIKD